MPNVFLDDMRASLPARVAVTPSDFPDKLLSLTVTEPLATTVIDQYRKGASLPGLIAYLVDIAAYYRRTAVDYAMRAHPARMIVSQEGSVEFEKTDQRIIDASAYLEKIFSNRPGVPANLRDLPSAAEEGTRA